MSADGSGNESGHDRQGHRFGGTWTERKLEVLAGYLRSYTTALKNQPTAANPFRKAFIDAFAGTGYRTARREDDDPRQQRLALPDLAEDEPQELLDGSAKIALRVEPPSTGTSSSNETPRVAASSRSSRMSFPSVPRTS